MSKKVFIESDGIVSVYSGDRIKYSESLEPKTYKIGFSMMGGFYLEEIKDIEPATDKIYGSTIKNSEHIVSYFNSTEDNVGVLFSGPKGYGKSLMSKYIAKVEKEQYKRPIIYVSEPFNGLKDFIVNFKNCIFIFDEFEKIFSSYKREEKDLDPNCKNGLSSQENFLTLFDGTSGSNHNMFIIIVNNVNRVSDYLIGRPGRIRYHYKFESVPKEDIIEYCNDNIADKDENYNVFIEDLSSFSMRNKISYDVLNSIVSEYNIFKGKLSDILSILNMECTAQNSAYSMTAVVINSKGKEETKHTRFGADFGFEHDVNAYLPGIGDVSFNTKDVIANYYNNSYSLNPEKLTFLDKDEYDKSYTCKSITIEKILENRSYIF